MPGRRSLFVLMALAFGFAFLYLPILAMIIYSFNASRLVTVWDSANSPTLAWYVELFHNAPVMESARLSFRIASVNATGAVILGTLAAFALERYRRFRGRALFGLLTTAPMVLPEVITGLSLLLLFVALEQAIGWPGGRGATTITIAHITFSMAYVIVVIQARLATVDRSLEEAAMDLGARPWKVFLVITLPLIMPAIASGWVLAFILSWDDLVITSFVSGPSSTTLPQLVFSKVRLGVSPDINALATILVLIVTVCVVVAGVYMVRLERRRTRDAQAAFDTAS
ncbi:MAG TPA: ABC transporter permease subunit [Steroidobacteraceae bacterium]|nr:ABC transporter permease subunit [Steroidobacteraceae bacterium]